MDTPRFSVDCDDATIELYDDRIRIQREGVINKIRSIVRGKSTKNVTIPLENIKEIKSKEPSMAWKGKITFVTENNSFSVHIGAFSMLKNRNEKVKSLVDAVNMMRGELDKEEADLSNLPREGISSSEGLLVRAKGQNGQLEVYENRVVIKRSGLLATLTHWGKGNKEIPIDKITGVQFKEPSKVTTGFIQIGQSGYEESKGGVFSATSDENSINFSKKEEPKFRAAKNKINELQSEKTKESTKRTDTKDSAIQKLRNRYAEGEISKEEFEERKEVLED